MFLSQPANRLNYREPTAPVDHRTCPYAMSPGAGENMTMSATSRSPQRTVMTMLFADGARAAFPDWTFAGKNLFPPDPNHVGVYLAHQFPGRIRTRLSRAARNTPISPYLDGPASIGTGGRSPCGNLVAQRDLAAQTK